MWGWYFGRKANYYRNLAIFVGRVPAVCSGCVGRGKEVWRVKNMFTCCKITRCLTKHPPLPPSPHPTLLALSMQAPLVSPLRRGTDPAQLVPSTMRQQPLPAPQPAGRWGLLRRLLAYLASVCNPCLCYVYRRSKPQQPVKGRYKKPAAAACCKGLSGTFACVVE